MLARRGPSKKKILVLSSTLIVIWAIIGVVVYRTFITKPPPSQQAPITLPPAATPGTEPVAPGAGSEVGLDILRDPRLTGLKLYGDVPLEVKALGRPNPFLLINP